MESERHKFCNELRTATNKAGIIAASSTILESLKIIYWRISNQKNFFRCGSLFVAWLIEMQNWVKRFCKFVAAFAAIAGICN
jgi:hypothetical protein